MEKDNFLLKEYDAATQLTYHVDELRSKLTGFFMTLGSIVAAAFTYLVKLEVGDNNMVKNAVLINILVLLSSIIGTIVILIVAKLRSAQLEHFRIVNNIREYFLNNDKNLWNIVELSLQTLPKPNRHSGTYFWVLLILIITSYYYSLAIYIFVFRVINITIKKNYLGYLLTILTFIISLFIHDNIYIKLAKPPNKRKYE